MIPAGLALILSNVLFALGAACMLAAGVLIFRFRRSTQLREGAVYQVTNVALAALVLALSAVVVGTLGYRPGLGVALVIGAAAWAALWLPPRMRRMRVVSHERIEVRPEQVFDCVTNPGMWPSYIDDLASVELLTPPPIRVGTRVQVVQLVDGREFHATEEFTEVERPRRSASHIRDARRPNLGTYQLEPADGGTLVTYTFETRLRFADALLGAVLLQKIGTESRIREHRARALAKLKGVLEAEAPLVSPAR